MTATETANREAEDNDTSMDPGVAEKRPLLATTVSFRSLFVKNWFATCVYCSVFCTFGICVAILGPTLTDLGCLTSSDIKAMSWVFFAQFLFVLVGSMLSGYLVNRYEADLLILVATIGLPLMMFIIPFCRLIGVLAVVLAIMGLCMGCLDCLANVQMIKTFGEAVTPFLQAMHFFYGLGAFFSPMIAEPFIYNADCSSYLHMINNSTDSTDTMSYGRPHSHRPVNASFVEEELKRAQEDTNVRFAFWIIAAVMIPIPFLVGLLILRKRSPDIEHKSLIESDSSASLELSSSDESPSKKDPVYPKTASSCFTNSDSQTMQVTLGMAAMLFIYDGLQSSFGAYVYSYALKSIPGLAKAEGAYLNASFWGTFAAGRLLSIFIATWFNPAFMLMTNTVGSLGAMIVMLVFRHDHIALYIGTCLFGLFLSSVTPTALSLAEQYVDLSSSNTALIVTIAATGEMVMPVVIGNAFAAYGPDSFLISGTVMTFVSLFVFAFIWLRGRTSPKLAGLDDQSFVWCQSYVVKRKRSKSKKRKHERASAMEMKEQESKSRVDP